ncbi:hypothetical protein FAX13_06030 [Ligilactobacillus animalis]|nr:hypothetical protein FAX13_06030 [Ligilactobacillus animalis]
MHEEAYREAIRRLKAEKEEAQKHCKLLYRSLAEIKDVNDAIMSDTDDEFKAVDVSYLNGFIDAKMSAIDVVVGDSYKGDDNDR